MTRGISFTALFALVMGSCSSMPYPYYGVGPDEEGRLQGKILHADPKDDEPLSVCAPDEQAKGKCVLVFVDTWERVLTDLQDYKRRAEACERNAD